MHHAHPEFRRVTVAITTKEKARLKQTLDAAANKLKSNRWRPFEEISDDESDEYNEDDDDAESVVDASDAYLDRDVSFLI